MRVSTIKHLPALDSRTIPLVLVCAALVNMLPYALYYIAGDMHVHLISLQCFGTQFYQGDFMPRWCFEADSGLGSPVLMFYFPFPYYIAMPLWPLHWLGVSTYAILALSILAATLLTAFTVFFWLRTVAGEKAACLAAIVYLFLPYRSEMLFSRVGLGELWCLAFLPLVCLGLRRLLTNKLNAMPLLTGSAFFSIFTHVPASVAYAICIAPHILVQGTARKWMLAGLALIIALLATLPYSLPAVLHYDFINISTRESQNPPWVNSYIDFERDYLGGRLRIVIGVIMMLSIITMLSVTALVRRKRLPDDYLRKETLLWAFSSIIAIFMLFPISAPIWKLINTIANVGMPWRMQSVLQLAVAYLFAVWLRYLTSTRFAKTGKGDIAVFFGLLLIMQYQLIAAVPDETRANFDKIVKARALGLLEYHTVYSDSAHGGAKYSLKRYLDGAEESRAEVVEGSCAAHIRQWNWQGIHLEVKAWKSCEIRLSHRYFPTWQLVSPPEGVILMPEKKSGWMKLSVAPGDHYVAIEPKPRWKLLKSPDDVAPTPYLLNEDTFYAPWTEMPGISSP